MSSIQNLGITIKAFDPLWKNTRGYTIPISNYMESYTHESTALGGFKSASIVMKVYPAMIDEWLDTGLGRHIVVYNEAGLIVWEGFVNIVSATIGTLAISRGPLMNIANRVAVIYTPILNIDVNPPIQGTKTEGLAAQDSTSQGKYGILETVISGGSLVDDGTINEATMLRDAYLAEYKFPESSENINLQSPSEPGLTLECLGYDAFLDKYVYNTTLSGSVQLPTKLKAVLAADPNGIFSTDYSQISDTTPYLLLVNQGESESRTARTVINDLLAVGDANNLRTLFGFYANQIAKYNVVPSSMEYMHYISNPSPYFRSKNNATIFPWEVKPGMWIFLPDYLVGKTPPASDLRGDPRYIFTESVQYSSVWGLQINGLRFGKVKQLQAKLGSGVW